MFLPTYGSWVDWIETKFAALRYFALNGTPGLGERPDRPTKGQLRGRPTDPGLDQLPGQGCMKSQDTLRPNS